MKNKIIPYNPKLKEYARQSGKTTLIRFLFKDKEYENFENPDIRLYNLEDPRGFFPSYREGFPNVVIQAGAMGLPSIATNINGCNKIFIEDQNGTIIPPKDPIALSQAVQQLIDNL